MLDLDPRINFKEVKISTGVIILVQLDAVPMRIIGTIMDIDSA